MPRQKVVAVAGAALCLAAAALVSSEWAARLPRPIEIPATAPQPLVTGAALLRLCFVADALLLLAWGWRRRSPRPPASPETAAPPVTSAETLAVAALTATALALRLYRAGTDLWVDEIVNLQIFREIPALQAAVAFRIANNHVLNTLLVKGMVALFGEREWAVRLPAIVFGTASVPVLWAVSRRVLGRSGSLVAALLLTFSYHHVFYSQNARGYAAHLFFGLAGAGLLSRALRGGEAASWKGYVAVTVGGLATLLHGFFVLAGQCLAAVACILLRRPGLTPAAARRLAGAFLLAGYLGLHLYALALPDAVASLAVVYQGGTMGYRLLSVEHLQEWVRGLAAGAGPGGIGVVLVALTAGAAGTLRALRRDAALVGALAAPLLLMAGFVLAGRLTVTPRSFLLGLPLALVCGVAALDGLLGRLPSGAARYAWPAAAALLALGSLLALRPYYRHPKQDFRGAIRYLQTVRRAQDPVLAVYLAKIGLSYYGPSLGLAQGRDLVVVQSVAEAEAARRPGTRRYAILTLAQVNRAEYPELDAYVRGRFRLLRRFPGTLGDGEVSVWVEED